MDLHGRGDGESECGELNMDMVQQVMAAKWAVDVINNQSLPHELKIGKNRENNAHHNRQFSVDEFHFCCLSLVTKYFTILFQVFRSTTRAATWT